MPARSTEDFVQDPVRHVVIDANVLTAFLHPGSVAKGLRNNYLYDFMTERGERV